MALALDETARDLAQHACNHLPPRMRVLFVTNYNRSGGWLADALASDSASEVILEEAVGHAAGLARMRDDVFDVVLVSHEPDDLDALQLVDALRAGGSDEPVLVVGSAAEPDFAPRCYEAGGDAYLRVENATTRLLLWTAARAIERYQLRRENRRLLQADRQRLQQEHDEAVRMLAEQRAIIGDLQSFCLNSAAGAFTPTTEWPPLPDNVVAHYRELLRAYVIMGSGNLTAEMGSLAELLTTCGVSAQQTMLMHLQVLEELVRGLGSRSARHVMLRADLLVLEMMIHLVEGYRQRYYERRHPPQQLALPGFDETVGRAA